MRVTVLTSTYPRFPGDGAAPFVRSLAVALAEAGHAVTVVAPHDIAVRAAPDDGISVRRFRYVWPDRYHIMGHARALQDDRRLRPLAIALVPPFAAGALVALWREVDRARPDIL
ncbi:MAG: hypothetical protein NZ518_07115, partial [Dehalococcoidia bacterium]|nr:hypothetical protein [Dehalococcoidia bacterium]